MQNEFDIEICNVFKDAELERKDLHHPYVGSEHLLLSLLKNSNNLKSICQNYNLTYDNFKNRLISIVGKAKNSNDINLYTPLLKRIINNSLQDAKETENKKVTKEILFLNIFNEGEGIAIRTLMSMDIDIDELYTEVNNSINTKKTKKTEIDKILNEIVNMDESIIDREKEINHIIEVLFRKKKNNPLLIGDAGVGKTAIVEELARRINKHDVPSCLENKRIIILNMSSLVAGTKYRGEFEEKINKIIKTIQENDNYILFIDEIHTMVNAGGAEGAICAGDILKPYLARGSIKCIGATTKQEFEKYILPDKALTRRFEIIEVLEPTKEKTYNILTNIKKEYELHHNVKITNNNLKLIIDYADSYFLNKKNPDKSIELLDTVCSYARIKNDKSKIIHKLQNNLNDIKNKKNNSIKNNNYQNAIELKQEELNTLEKINTLKNQNIIKISINDIKEVIEKNYHIPLINKKEKELNIIKKKLINKYPLKEEIINNVINKINNKKISKLLTISLDDEILTKEIIKTLGNNNLLEIDLNDYNYYSSIYNLIGNPNNYSQSKDNYIFKQIINNYFNIIILKNYHNSNNEIQNIFSKIIKNNKIIDNYGNLINFNNCIMFIIKEITPSNSIGFSKTSNEHKITN